MNMSKPAKTFKKFKYREQEFTIGDICRFFIENSHELIGKITQILSTDPTHKDFAKIKI